MGYVKDAEAALDDDWQGWRREVRRLHEKLFYRPLLEAAARMPDQMTDDEAGLSADAAVSRLAALGFVDPKAALRNLEALTSGVTRTASIQKALMPVDARLVRRLARPGRRPVRVPPAQRVARLDPVVPLHPPRRGTRGRAAGPRAGHLAVRDHAHRARAAGRPDARRGPHPSRRDPADVRDDRVGRPPGRPRRGGPLDPCRAPSRAVAALGRRPVRRDRRGRRGGRPVPADRRHPRGDPRGRRPLGPRAAGARRGADRDRRGGDGAVRRLRAVLRQRRRRDVRARAGARRRPARRGDVRPDRRQRAAPPARPAHDRPAARGGRRPAARGQAGPAGADPRLLRRLLRQVVGGLGVPGAAARRRRRRRRRASGSGSPS